MAPFILIQVVSLASFSLLLVALQVRKSRAFSVGPIFIKSSSSWKCRQHSTRTQQQTKSSLTDDDDFALVGFNTDVTPPNLVDISPAVAPNTQPQAQVQANSFTWPKSPQSKEGSEESQPLPSNVVPVSSTAAVSFGLQSAQDTIALDGLTVDGDFILEGINAIDPTAGQALKKYGSPLGVAESASQENNGDILSSLSLNQGSSSNFSGSKNDDQILGLTDDGDLALMGLNTVESSSTESNGGIRTNYIPQPWEDNRQENAAKSNVAAASNTATSVRRNSPQEVQEIITWIFGIIPTLRDEDCVFYADQLVSLGLNPNCITQCELQMDDFAFMKPLHQRYLFNEVTGIPHPWEP